MSAIIAKDLSKAFPGVQAVSALNLDIKKGEIFGLVGPDGSGKTTTMRLLTSILDPTSGEAFVNGWSIIRDGEALKSDIGYMSQRFGLYPDLSVEENINFFADIYEISQHNRGKKIDELLSFSGLIPFKKRLAGNLSGGMKQKLGLACVLIHTPKILFLDEPTNGVDPVSRRDFWKILHELLKTGVTIFFSTAYLDEAERATRVGLINEGKLLAVGTPDQLKKEIKGAILGVTVKESRAAIAILKQFYGDSVRLFGSRIHIATEEPAKARVETLDALAKAGYKDVHIEKLEPSLEDVFIAMMTRRAF